MACDTEGEQGLFSTIKQTEARKKKREVDLIYS